MAKILMVAAEATGFASAGGLGDVIAALPPALAEGGEQVAVVLPFYAETRISELQPIYERLPVQLGPHRYVARVFEHLGDRVRWLFVEIPGLFDRPGIYDENGRAYPDNHVRFGALCEAALGVARRLFPPDIIHCHDWHAALVPVFLNQRYHFNPFYAGIRTVLTVHNLGYQGWFPPGALADLGLSDELFRSGVIEHFGRVNLLKAGLILADAVTTVSPTYAKQIQTPAFGAGLDTVLRRRANGVIGILNGADNSWDPATDPYIEQHFDCDDLTGKQASKRALVAEAGLAENRMGTPLAGVVSRLVEQKGFDLLMQIPHEFAAEDLALIVLGNGEQRFEDFFRWFSAAYPDRVAVRIGYDTALARRIIAGSDLFLMPSRYEPCGLNQMYAMRYGTLPIVRATGGLDDTVDADTGFKFADDHPRALLDCVRSARRVFATPRWTEMMRTAMQRNFSWAASAREYIRLYRSLTD